ncbi:MAG: TIR domain-containing protein [Vulcanimicrobiota bacterium]
MSKSSSSIERFDAFISYSHAADRLLAIHLQKALEGLAKPWYRLRSVRIFRDETDLAATPGAWKSIQAALESSRYLILLGCPTSAASKWVGEEVKYWVQDMGRVENLLLVRSDGTFAWGDQDFDWGLTDALPAALRKAYQEEPLWVDLGWARSSPGTLSLRNPEFLQAAARLSAPIRGMELKELVSEDVREHKRTRWVAGTALLTIFTSLLGVALFFAHGSYVSRLRGQLLAISQSLKVDPSQGLKLAVTLTEEFQRPGMERLFPAEYQATKASLVEALQAAPVEEKYNLQSPVCSVSCSPKGDFVLMGCQDGRVWRWDNAGHSTPKVVLELELREEKPLQAVEFRSCRFAWADGTVLMGAANGKVFVGKDGTTWKEVLSLNSPVTAIAAQGETVAVGLADGHVEVHYWSGGRLEPTVSTELSRGEAVTAIASVGNQWWAGNHMGEVFMAEVGGKVWHKQEEFSYAGTPIQALEALGDELWLARSSWLYPMRGATVRCFRKGDDGWIEKTSRPVGNWGCYDICSSPGPLFGSDDGHLVWYEGPSYREPRIHEWLLSRVEILAVDGVAADSMAFVGSRDGFAYKVGVRDFVGGVELESKRRPRFSADGRYLQIFSTREGQAEVWDLDSCQPLSGPPLENLTWEKGLKPMTNFRVEPVARSWQVVARDGRPFGPLFQIAVAKTQTDGRDGLAEGAFRCSEDGRRVLAVTRSAGIQSFGGCDLNMELLTSEGRPLAQLEWHYYGFEPVIGFAKGCLVAYCPDPTGGDDGETKIKLWPASVNAWLDEAKRRTASRQRSFR